MKRAGEGWAQWRVWVLSEHDAARWAWGRPRSVAEGNGYPGGAGGGPVSGNTYGRSVKIPKKT